MFSMFLFVCHDSEGEEMVTFLPSPCVDNMVLVLAILFPGACFTIFEDEEFQCVETAEALC